MAMADNFSSTLLNAGLVNEEVEYLRARGISTLRLLSRVAKSDDDYEMKIIEPFINGKNINDRMYRSSRSPTIVRAAFLVAFDEARRPDPLGPLPVLSQRPADAQITSSQPSKVPTVLRKGLWRENVEKWQDQWTPPRAFNEDAIYGAEEALARLEHELNVSRSFSLIKLGEITATRSWRADGELNRDADKHKRRKSGVDITVNDVPISVGLSTEDNFNLSSWWAIHDDFEAQRWALLWAGYGSDDEVDRWVSFWQLECRSRTLTTSQLDELFEATTCQVTTRMRKGSTFGEAAREVLLDGDGWLTKYKNQIRNRASARAAVSSETPAQAFPGAHPKNMPAKIEKRKPPRDDRRDRDSGPDSKRPRKASRDDRSRWSSRACHNYQVGRCNFKGCKFAHECAICGATNHKAPACDRR